MRRFVIAATLLIAACSSAGSTDVEEPTAPATEAPSSTEAPAGDTLMVGAGSASILPTVDGTTDFDGGVAWMQANPGNNHYMFSKQAMCYFVASRAYEFGKCGVRINAICPGPTDTPLARSNEDLWLSFGSDFRDEIGVGASTPEEQGDVMAFLGSHAARYLSGQTIIVDAGLDGAGLTDAYPAATPIVKFLHGIA